MKELVSEITEVKYKLSEFDLTKLLSPQIIKVLGETDFRPVSLLLIKEHKDEKTKKLNGVSIVSMSYHGKADIDNKILHISGKSKDEIEILVEKLDKVIEDAKKRKAR